jgi:hypothetical protein
MMLTALDAAEMRSEFIPFNGRSCDKEEFDACGLVSDFRLHDYTQLHPQSNGRDVEQFH